MLEAWTNTASAALGGSRRTNPSASQLVNGVKATSSQRATSAATTRPVNRRSRVVQSRAQASAHTTTTGPVSPQKDMTECRPRSSIRRPASAPAVSPTSGEYLPRSRATSAPAVALQSDVHARRLQIDRQALREVRDELTLIAAGGGHGADERKVNSPVAADLDGITQLLEVVHVNGEPITRRDAGGLERLVAAGVCRR